jgi:hypothetical protein
MINKHAGSTSKEEHIVPRAKRFSSGAVNKSYSPTSIIRTLSRGVSWLFGLCVLHSYMQLMVLLFSSLILPFPAAAAAHSTKYVPYLHGGRSDRCIIF